MRTKTLLLSAAALAAGIFSAQAQSNVYSANVVGYVNVVLTNNGQFTLCANPFDDGNGNQLTNILNGSLPTKSQVLTWNGATFNIIQKTASGWPSSIPLPPGTGFFVRNGNPGAGSPSLTNTFVGSIIVPNHGSVTNQEPIGFTLQGSPIPYAGNLAIATQNGGDTNMDFGGPLTTKSQILTWNIGSQVYNIAQKTASGWPSTVSIVPGEGFFINNKNGPATNVVETLNIQ